MQELQKILRGQQELFLTALPMHIVLAIDECCVGKAYMAGKLICLG